MDFMDYANLAISGDITNIEIPIPDEFQERLEKWSGEYYMLIIDLAQHFYGDNPTPEQMTEMPLLMAMWMRKAMGADAGFNG